MLLRALLLLFLISIFEKIQCSDPFVWKTSSGFITRIVSENLQMFKIFISPDTYQYTMNPFFDIVATNVQTEVLLPIGQK